MAERTPRILFVEDDVGKRYVIARQLRAYGFDVQEAETGEQGIALVSPEHDVAILDIKLPDMMGWDVCKRIKSNPETAMVKVLELSATLASAEDRAKGLEHGADAYLVHPVEMVELVASIRALVRLRDAEREKQRALELFLATLSHDLRAPLASVATGLDVLYSSDTMHQDDRETILRLSRVLDRLQRMVDQLLVFTQSVADVVPVSRQRVDLAEIARTVVSDGGYLKQRDITIVAERGVRLDADIDKLQQLLDNLIANAIKHGEGPITIRIEPAGDHALLSVHNHGTPIPPAAIPTLFDPFVRVGNRKGFGLGLYIVDQIARAHRGSVGVSSNADQGTTFVVRFPLE